MTMKPLAVVGTALACAAAASAGGLVTAQSLDSPWYRTLRKPDWQPPTAVFGPVWTLLYCLIAVSGAIAFSRPGGEATGARKAWVVQMVLNLAWSVAFFGLRSPLGGLLVIIALWVAIMGYVRRVRRVSWLAAWLFVPYALWVSFATALNAWIWWHNREPGG